MFNCHFQLSLLYFVLPFFIYLFSSNLTIRISSVSSLGRAIVKEKKKKRKEKEKQEKTKRSTQTSLLADHLKPRTSRTAENQWLLYRLQVSIRSTIVLQAERVLGASLVSHTLSRLKDLSRTTATRQTLDSRWNFAAENLFLQKW